MRDRGDGRALHGGEGEPAEISGIKAELETMAGGVRVRRRVAGQGDGGVRGVAEALLQRPEAADLLGERHRIIANNWQVAGIELVHENERRWRVFHERIEEVAPES